MVRPYSSGNHRPFGQVEYIVTDGEETQRFQGVDYAENPCQNGDEQDCTEWLQLLMTACYND